MADRQTGVFAGGYRDIESATNHFDVLTKLVAETQLEIEAAHGVSA
jgi:hypothetical protein